MTNQHDAPATTPASESAPVAARGGVGRRFLIASTPIVITLASRTALAGGGKDLVCTASAMASATYMSHHKDPLPQQCGVHPDVWHNHGSTGCAPNVWDTCANYSTGSNVSSCFNLGGNTRWKCTTTFLPGLAAQYTFQCKISGTWRNCPTDFTKHAVAAICNASSWGGSGHYPLTVSGVNNYLYTNVWSKSPYSTTSMTTICNTATGYFIGCLPA